MLTEDDSPKTVEGLESVSTVQRITDILIGIALVLISLTAVL